MTMMEQAFLRILGPLFESLKDSIKNIVYEAVKGYRIKEYMSLDEAAKYLNINKSTLKLKVRNGEIKAYKPSQKIYFRLEDLVKYIEGGELTTVKEEEEKLTQNILNRHN
jgi:excisionase family DNA binding protein